MKLLDEWKETAVRHGVRNYKAKNGKTYTIRTSGIQLSDEPNLVQVTVTVSWTERGNNASVQFVTYYPKI